MGSGHSFLLDTTITSFSSLKEAVKTSNSISKLYPGDDKTIVCFSLVPEEEEDLDLPFLWKQTVDIAVHKKYTRGSSTEMFCKKINFKKFQSIYDRIKQHEAFMRIHKEKEKTKEEDEETKRRERRKRRKEGKEEEEVEVEEEEEEDEEEEQECIICCTNKSNIVLSCTHRFCETCVSPLTPVSLACGLSVPLTSLEGLPSLSVCSFSSGKIRREKVSNVLRRGKKQTVTMTLSDQRQLTCTRDHRVLTESGWKRVDQLILTNTEEGEGEGSSPLSSPSGSPSCKGDRVKVGPLLPFDSDSLETEEEKDFTLCSLSMRKERHRVLAAARLLGAIAASTLSSSSSSPLIACALPPPPVFLSLESRFDMACVMEDIDIVLAGEERNGGDESPSSSSSSSSEEEEEEEEVTTHFNSDKDLQQPVLHANSNDEDDEDSTFKAPFDHTRRMPSWSPFLVSLPPSLLKKLPSPSQTIDEWIVSRFGGESAPKAVVREILASFLGIVDASVVRVHHSSSPQVECSAIMQRKDKDNIWEAWMKEQLNRIGVKATFTPVRDEERPISSSFSSGFTKVTLLDLERFGLSLGLRYNSMSSCKLSAVLSWMKSSPRACSTSCLSSFAQQSGCSSWLFSTSPSSALQAFQGESLPSFSLPVVSISSDGDQAQEVCDLSVHPSSPSFLAGGMVVHNCIKQWHSKSNTCPMCRSVDQDDNMFVLMDMPDVDQAEREFTVFLQTIARTEKKWFQWG